jgi:hypothetical protein
MSTAVLPEGWEERLVHSENQSSQPGRGLCLELPIEPERINSMVVWSMVVWVEARRS